MMQIRYFDVAAQHYASS